MKTSQSPADRSGTGPGLGSDLPPEARGDGARTAGLSPGVFAALLGLLIFVCFPQVVLGLETFYDVDYGQFGYPLAFHHRESFWRGEVPLWNPLNDCGVPFLAQWNTLTLYPASLAYLLLPLPWSLTMFCLGHLWLAGLGMYCLTFQWTRHRLGAAVAGVAFAFNGFTWYALMWPNNLAGLAWMPWVVRMAGPHRKSGARSCAGAAAVAAMQLLSGAPEVCLLTWLCLALMWAAECGRPDLRPGARVGWAAAFGLLAVALAAVQLLPFLDLLAHSHRSAEYGRSAVGGIAAMPLTGWANYLVPLFGCVPDHHGAYHQANQTWLGSYYAGVGVVALAVMAAWRARDRHTRVYLGLTLFSLLMALGSAGGVYDAFQRWVPLFGFMRYPVKFVILATFTLPLLAGSGLAWLQRVPAGTWPRERERIQLLVVVLWGLMAAILGWAWTHPLTPGHFAALAANTGVRGVFLVAVLGTAVALRRSLDSKLRLLLQASLVVLLWLDIFTHAPELSPTLPASVLQPGSVRRFFGWAPPLAAGDSRACQGREAFWGTLAPQAKNPEQELTARRMALSMNFNLLDRVAKFDGFYSLEVKEFLDVFQQVYFTTNTARPLLDFLGVSLASNPANPLDWLARDSFLPLLTAGQQPAFLPDADALATVVSERFEPRRVVFLPPESQRNIRASGPATATVRHLRCAPHRIEAEVETDAPTFVVVAQTYYHRWRARVDGKIAPLHRANHAFQALEVPAGIHRVVLTYRDPRFLGGAILSVTSLLSCAGLWILGRGVRARVPNGSNCAVRTARGNEGKLGRS